MNQSSSCLQPAFTEAPGPAPTLTKTVDSRRARRNQRAARSIQAGLLAKVVQIISRLVTVPISLRLLGQYQYGLWLAAGSILNWLGLSNLGFSAGIINVVSEADGRDDHATLRAHVSTSAAFFGGTSVLLAICAGVLTVWPGLAAVLGVSGDTGAIHSARLVVLISGLCLAAGAFCGLASTVCAALQENYLGSICFAASGVVSLLALLVLRWIGHSSLATYACVVGLPSVLTGFAFTAYYFGRRRPDLRPAFRYTSWASLRRIAAPSLLVFASQIGDMAIQYSSNLIIASHMGPSSVPRYAITYAIFMMGQSVVWDFLQPMWPAYTEALARGDHEWVRSTFRKSLCLCAGLMLAIDCGVYVLGRWFVRIWAGAAAVPPSSLIVALGLYFFVWTLMLVCDVLVRGLGLFKLRAVVTFPLGFVFVGSSILAFPRLGLHAPPAAGIVSTGIAALVYSHFIRTHLRSVRPFSARRQEAAI